MRALIWKEWRESVKWAVLPGLLILLPMILLGWPSEALPDLTGAFLFYLLAAVPAAALGFVQVFFEAQGDRRALLLHRPISRSRIFLSKAWAGLGIYFLAQAIPFVCVQVWMAIPGHMAAPWDWRSGLPWVADVLAGVVYYFAGMLLAQREARWLGSRTLGLATASFGTFLVWSLPEFWQALLVIALLATVVGLAAWGSFLAGGAYAPQPEAGRAALALTLLAGLFVVSFIGKAALGQWLDSGLEYTHVIDRQGRMLVVLWKTGTGPLEAAGDLEGEVPPGLRGKRIDRNALTEIEAPWTNLEWPIFRSYRNPGRLYVHYFNATRPGGERWFYVPAEGRLVGYDAIYGQKIGSFGPDGFSLPGEEPRERFAGELSYPSRLWDAFSPSYLAFSAAVYSVDFTRRTVHKLYTAEPGETVVWASRWQDRRTKESLAVVSTDRSVHFLTEAGARVIAVPRDGDLRRYRVARVSRLESPQRYAVWYAPLWCLEPDEARAAPAYLLEYDSAGRQVARRSLPSKPDVEPARAKALFGLATPMTEATSLIGLTRSLRAEARSEGGTSTWPIQYLLEEWTGHFLPRPKEGPGRIGGLPWGFAALVLLSSAGCALICFAVARRYAFSRGRCAAWALCGFVFGVAGLLLLLSVQDWPARVACPACGKGRLVTRDACEHCGAAHAPPAADGTEIFEEVAAREGAPAGC
jgi:hypothetical protein